MTTASINTAPTFAAAQHLSWHDPASFQKGCYKIFTTALVPYFLHSSYAASGFIANATFIPLRGLPVSYSHGYFSTHYSRDLPTSPLSLRSDCTTPRR